MKKNTIAQITGVAGGVTAVGAAVYAYSHRNEPRKKVTPRQARKIGEELGIDWTRFAPEEFRRGMAVELEHGLRNPMTDVTGDNLLLTGKIALAHLEEFPDYYTRLTRMEEEAKAYWSSVAAAVPVEEAVS